MTTSAASGARVANAPGAGVHNSAAGSRPVVLNGPSGVGKSTLIKRLFDEFPNTFGFSVSHTTRKMRAGEEDGKSYHFVSREEFERLIREDAFLEYAQFGGNYYGTSIKAVQDVNSEASGHRRAFLDIDAQGMKILREKHAYLNPIFIFIAPPRYAVLRDRLEGRATDAPEAIQRRLTMAVHEMHNARKPDAYDYIIVNDDLNRAYQLLRAAVMQDTSDTQFDQVPAPDDAEHAAQRDLVAQGHQLA